jgi:hypothetical protein
VLFVGAETLWFETFDDDDDDDDDDDEDDDEIVGRMLVVFGLTTEDKLLDDVLFETAACVLFRSIGKV